VTNSSGIKFRFGGGSLYLLPRLRGEFNAGRNELTVNRTAAMFIVFTTTPDRALANTLADKLVREKLAACVQILPQMTSVYVWEGEVRRDEEHLLLIKTSPTKYTVVESCIKKNHTYAVPEIVAVETKEVSEGYRAWLEGYLQS
jgi:periplasmic divalent cation tolerance protein